jgi:hypothetical protein
LLLLTRTAQLLVIDLLLLASLAIAVSNLHVSIIAQINIEIRMKDFASEAWPLSELVAICLAVVKM